MSYLKLFKVTQDTPVGYQTVNQACANNTAMLELYDAQHGAGIGGYNTGQFVNPIESIGRHDDVRIARSVLYAYVDTSLPTPILVPRVAGPIFGSFVFRRLAPGQWRIWVGVPYLVGATAMMKATATADYKATCYVSYDASTGPAITVTTWGVDGGSWTPLDLDFSLSVWANR